MFFHYIIVFSFLCNYASLYCSYASALGTRTSPYASPVVSDSEDETEKENKRNSISNHLSLATKISAESRRLLDRLQTAVINYTEAKKKGLQAHQLIELQKVAAEAVENFPDLIKQANIDAAEKAIIWPHYKRLQSKFRLAAPSAKVTPASKNKSNRVMAPKNNENKKNTDSKHIPISSKSQSEQAAQKSQAAGRGPAVPVTGVNARSAPSKPQIPLALQDQLERGAKGSSISHGIPILAMQPEPLPQKSLLTDKPAPRVKLEPFPEETQSRMSSAVKYACVTGLFAWLLYKIYYYDQVNQEQQNDQQKS